MCCPKLTCPLLQTIPAWRSCWAVKIFHNTFRGDFSCRLTVAFLPSEKITELLEMLISLPEVQEDLGQGDEIWLSFLWDGSSYQVSPIHL